MAHKRTTNFQAFRFQLLPVDNKSIQLDHFTPEISTPEELVANKNKILGEILTSEHIRFTDDSREINSRREVVSENSFLFKIGVRKETTLTNSELEDFQVENYPNVKVIINNDPNIQAIFIEKNPAAFSSPSALKNSLLKFLSKHLTKKWLDIYIEPIREEGEFWSFVEKNQDRIVHLEFDLIRPNMSKISQTFDDELKELQTSTNSTRSTVNLYSNPSGFLRLERTNNYIKGLNEYCAKGGGEISVRLRGMKKKISVNNKKIELSIEEGKFEGSKDDVREFIEKLGDGIL